MAEPNGGPPGHHLSGLRERISQTPEMPQKAQSVDTAQEAVLALNAQEAAQNKKEKDKKTYGRTPDGTGEYLSVHASTWHWAGLRGSGTVMQVKHGRQPTAHQLVAQLD